MSAPTHCTCSVWVIEVSCYTLSKQVSKEWGGVGWSGVWWGVVGWSGVG